MLLVGMYDYTPREEDSSKTIGFKVADVLLFLDVYQKDGNWLQVIDLNGRIGYIPKNYVQMSEEINRDSVLEFVLEATLRARKEKLDSVETLENLKEHVVRIEYREFQSRQLRKALSFHTEDENVEIEDGTTTTDDQYRKSQISPIGRENMTPISKKNFLISANGSNSSFHTLKSENHRDSITSTPLKSIHKIPVTGNSNRNVSVEQPIPSRASKSCPLGPNGNSFSAESIDAADKYASGDNLAPILSNRTFNLSFRQDSSKTRIPIRTPSNKSYRSQGGTQSLEFSDQSQSRNFSEANSENWERMASRLITIVQESGGLDLKQSEAVVHRVLHHVQEHFNPGMPEKLKSVLRVLEKSPTTTPSCYIENGTCKRVIEILKFFTHKGNENFQNTFVVQDDESVIMDKLDQFQEELLNLNPKLFKHAMEANHYHGLHDLVRLYQSEGRMSIRSKLLDIFSMISTMDNAGRSVLLGSVLPIELSKEVYGNETSPRKLSRLSQCLISLMSAGECMPETHYDHLGIKFITFILTFLEDPAQDETNEKAKADFMNLLLAYNLQFTPKDENYIIKTLAGRSPGRYFIETLLHLFENEVDPIKSGSESSDLVPHSVFKLMKDMFSCKMTAEHFHTAEMKMLIDSMTQRLSNLSPGDNKRTENLGLIGLLLRNRAFKYRISDIRECLVSILLEEDPLSIPDQRIIRGISKEFPTVFKKGKNTFKNTLDNHIHQISF